mmetsp:Transcript_42667/g.106187  ORF Transcript_42667/g.106187 Transcript_42667/m.106187 type:complete len:203 (-) Transcript_42667:2325-2933(-)
MKSARPRSAAAARSAIVRASPGDPGCAASASRRNATRRSRIAANRRDKVPTSGTLSRSLDSGSASCCSSGPADSCTVAIVEGSSPRALPPAGSRWADDLLISSHSALKAASASSSVFCDRASEGKTRDTSSSTVAGSSASWSPDLSGPGRGSLPMVESAKRLGARRAFAIAAAAAEFPACAMVSRTAASVTLAASSSRSSCT